jgi:membrane dipeptidase
MVVQRGSVLYVTAMVMLAACASAPSNVQQRAADIAHRAIIVDTHIDAPYRVERAGGDITQATATGDFDYPRARTGGLDVAFMSIFIPADVDAAGGGRALADRLIDQIDATVARAPDRFARATCVADVRRNVAAGLISLPLGMENGGPLAAGDDAVEHFYQRGIRYVTLAHAKSNALSDSSYDGNERWHGLSDRGRAMVLRLNDLGVMVDVSHLSDRAFWDVMSLSAAPVIASHSSARFFLPGFQRDLSDDMIRALAAQGGVVQVNFGSAFINAEARAWVSGLEDALKRFEGGSDEAPDSADVAAFAASYRAEHPFPYASVDDVLDHIDHIVQLVGVDGVGLGSDFDGVGDTLPDGLKDVSMYPNLIAGLLRRGYDESQIRRILGENLLRVWRDVEQIAVARGGSVACVAE